MNAVTRRLIRGTDEPARPRRAADCGVHGVRWLGAGTPAFPSRLPRHRASIGFQALGGQTCIRPGLV